MKKIILLLIVAIFALSAGACGKKSPQSEANKEGKFLISIAAQNEDGEQQILRILAEEYQKLHPEVKFDITSFGTSDFTGYMSKYASMQDGLPMIMWAPDDKFAPFAEGGYFEDLRPYYEASAETSYDLYYDSMLDAANYYGDYRPYSENPDRKYGLYFAPRDRNQISIVYNKNLFDKFSIEVPDTSNGWTMEEFFALVKTINDKIATQVEAKRTQRAIGLRWSWEPVYTSIFNYFGTDGIIKDGAFNIGSEKNKEIVGTMYDELFSLPYAYAENGDNFPNGQMFMTVVSRPAVLAYSNQIKDVDGNPAIDFLPFPTQQVCAGCSGYAIVSKHANETQEVNGEKRTNKDLCWDFIKFVISREGQEIAGATGFSQPILKSLEENGAWKSAISSELNHDAWTQGEELRITLFNGFAPVKRPALRNNVSTFFSQSAIKNWNDASTQSLLISKYVDAFAMDAI